MNTEPVEAGMDRREFFRRVGAAALAGAGLALGLAACGGGDKGNAESTSAATSKPAVDPCSDLSGLTQDELATRTTFQYKAVAADPAKVCTKCNFWHAPEGGSPCGTCTLVKGPIEPAGGCMSWVEIQKT